MQYVVNVILDLPLRQTFSYLSNQELTQGDRVVVEFRHRQKAAFVANCVAASDFTSYPVDKLSLILSHSPTEYSIPKHIWKLCEFAASYYHHPLGPALFCAVPAQLRQARELDSTPQAKVKAKIKTQAKLSSATIPLAQTAAATRPQLNPEQQQIVDALLPQLNSYHPCLLYGITGSGKTEVFLQLIALVLAHQQQVLVLVPEINLTPQLAARFKQRFAQSDIRILNSEISAKSRLNNWLAAKTNQAQIILGTRLAVFTPCHNLGLIIVDEEHDDSFKQNDALRYHARDLAVWRAKNLNIPIILASATPALETLYNYKQGKYSLYKLTKRASANAELPQIKLINLQHYPVNFAGISQIALDKLAECLARKELAILFINRRGYAPIISCYDCGWVSSCRNCTTKMVYHHDKQQLKCHHCSYQIKVPSACPVCHNQYLHTIGHGTQKLEQFLAEYFPMARIARVDRDSTHSKQAWQDLYHKIEHEQVDILVGTQMLAKGHDFANLTLVIGLNLDNALYSYDFRASEDMFNTLTQVAGRAGRAAKPGLVLLQTNYPDHPLYKFLIEHDFSGFINYTLKERSQHGLPPFNYYALVKLSSNYPAKLNQAMQQLKILSNAIAHPGVSLFPPVPAVIAKLHNKYRGQMLISTKERRLLHNYLANLELQLTQVAGVSIGIDVDPFEL